MKIIVELNIDKKGFRLDVNGKNVSNGSHYSMVTNKDLINCFINGIEENEFLTKDLNEEDFKDFLEQLKRITFNL